jgi:hypothetical protein
LTPSDVPLTRLDQRQLERLVKRTRNRGRR